MRVVHRKSAVGVDGTGSGYPGIRGTDFNLWLPTLIVYVPTAIEGGDPSKCRLPGAELEMPRAAIFNWR